MVENIRLSFQGLWAHKMRSFLTMLGIIIGIASLISIVSTIKGTSEQIKKNLIGEGDNVVDITLNEGSNIYQMEYQGIPQGVPVATEEQKQQILDLDNVENASLYSCASMQTAFTIRIKAWKAAKCWEWIKIIWTPADIRSSGGADFPKRILTISVK